MKTERFKNLFLVLCFALLPMAMMAKQEATVSSPSGNLTLTVGVDNAGRPYYSLRRSGEVILLPSALGMKLKDGSLDSDFRVVALPELQRTKRGANHGEKKSMCATITTS